MPKPNRQQKQGKLRKKRPQGVVRPVRESVGPARPGFTPAPARPSAPPVLPPATPRYGPNMQRARRDADMRYGDAILAAQAGVQSAGSWFDQYKTDVAKAQQDVAARYAQAQQQVAAIAPTVGPGVSSPEGDQAAASRAVMQQAFGNLLTAQGNAQQDYFAGRGTVGSAQQLQARQQATAQVNQLGREKADYTLNRRDELRDQQRTAKLENAIWESEFGLKLANAQQDAAMDRESISNTRADNRRADKALQQANRNAKIRRRKENETPNQYGYSAEDWLGMSTQERQDAILQYKKNTQLEDPKGPDGLTPAQRRALREKRAKARTGVETVSADMGAYGQLDVQILDDKGEPTGKSRKPTRDEVFARLRKEGASQDQIIVALALRHGTKTWDARTRAAAKRLGYGVPKKYLPKINKSPNLQDRRGEAAQGASVKDLADVNSRSDAAQREGATSYRYRPRRYGPRLGQPTRRA
jgi:hypothetical protein